jgi:hypothetical protein
MNEYSIFWTYTAFQLEMMKMIVYCLGLNAAKGGAHEHTVLET